MATQKPVTLKTISEKLNISVTAVSRALRGDTRISEETRRRVRETAHELNYRPNSIAKSLRTNETKTLGLVIAESTFSVFASVVDGVEKVAKKMGYNIILISAHSGAEMEKEAVRTLINKRIDGLLLAASALTAEKYKSFFDSFDIPYVFLVRPCEYESGDYVVTDNVNGVCQMISYLIKTGSKKIHFINLPADIRPGQDRLMGYRKALEENGIAYDSSIVYHVKPDVDSGYNQMTNLLDSGESVEAVFCGCDMIAVGVMESILEHGYKIPQDIRVSAHDDIELAAYLRVPLTTIRVQRYQIGALGTELLIEKITKNKNLHINRVLKAELVLREST